MSKKGEIIMWDDVTKQDIEDFEGWYIATIIGADGKYTVGVNTKTGSKDCFLRVRSRGTIETAECKMIPYSDVQVYGSCNAAYLVTDWAAVEPEIKIPPRNMTFFELLRWWLNEQLT